jgi:hypothetical protein
MDHPGQQFALLENLEGDVDDPVFGAMIDPAERLPLGLFHLTEGPEAAGPGFEGALIRQVGISGRLVRDLLEEAQMLLQLLALLTCRE